MVVKFVSVGGPVQEAFLIFHAKITIFSWSVRHPLGSQSRVADQDRKAGDCALSPGYGRRTVPAQTKIAARLPIWPVSRRHPGQQLTEIQAQHWSRRLR